MRLSASGGELFTAFPSREIILCNQSVNGWSTFWRELRRAATSAPLSTPQADLPFPGGVMGYLGYEQPPGIQSTGFPTAAMGIYPHYIYINHLGQKAEFISLTGTSPADTGWQAILKTVNQFTSPPASPGFELTRRFLPLTPFAQYRQHFGQIQRYLSAGDCYQVNYAQCFHARCRGSSAGAMTRLLAIGQPACAAWLTRPEGDVLCLSPELFLQIKDGVITSRPIKGTAPRSADPAEDAALQAALAASTKNRAENLMIVDLMRHDIGRHAVPGSVQVRKLFEVETLPQVHHLVSTVTARLKPGSSAIDLVRDCFPGGSITGAPKKRAMEIIRELEPTPRSVYCGSIGFIGANGDAHLNIAIRTLLRMGEDLYAWAGGGIVADSECEAEYQECFHKIGALMRALEQPQR